MNEKKTAYEQALLSHTNKYTKSTALSMGSNESAYRDSANKLKSAYAEYAEAMKSEGNPIPRWF